jgi:membrane protein required for colicin V production
MPDVKLPSKDDLMKLRDMSTPAQPDKDHVHPAAATTAATS